MRNNLALLRLLLAICLVNLLGSCDKQSNVLNVTDIPSYYYDNSYLDNRVKAINDAIAVCSGDCEAFFWITDMHWEPEFNTRKSPLLIKYIASRTGICKILNGGDTADSKEICEDAISQLRNAISSNNVYTVTGNHEICDASRYESPYMRISEALRGHNTAIVYGDNERSYFYYDDATSRIRFIGLASFGLYIDNEYESCYNAKQLTWLQNTALRVESDWSIIIFTHTLYYVDIKSDNLVTCLSGAKTFVNAIDNYKGNGTILCVLMGHAHRDRVHIGVSGVPYIISASDRHNPYIGDINIERIPGTISEQHFEVVVVDKKKKQIKLFSIGANARDGYDNDRGKEVDVRTVNY